MHPFTRRITRLSAIGLVSLGLSPAAKAGLTLTFSDGVAADTLVFTDAATPGFISVPIGTMVGIFKFRAVLMPPAPGDSRPGDITSTQATLSISAGGTGKTLTITEVSTPVDFTPPGALASRLESDYAPTRLTDGASTTFSSSAVGSASSASTPTTTVTTTGDFVKTASFSPTTPGPFSITSILTFTPHATNDQLADSFTTTITAVPEPASIVALATALPLVGAATRRRRRTAQA